MDATLRETGREGGTTMLLRHLPASLAAVTLVGLPAVAHAQSNALSPTLAGSPSGDQGVVTERKTAPPTAERFSMFLGVGVAAGESLSMREAGRSYSVEAERAPLLAIAACRRIGVACLGYQAHYQTSRSLRLSGYGEALPSLGLSSFTQGPFVRLELGKRVRFRPSFGIAFGGDTLRTPDAKLESGRVDARLGLDVAIPLGRHALVIQAGGLLPLATTSLFAKDRPEIAQIDIKEQPSAYIAIGPELRL